MREFDLLKHVFQGNDRLPASVTIPPGDDMAMVAIPSTGLLVAVDQIVDGRHVKVGSTPIELIGRKAVTRSLSDIAAMAGTPVAALVAVTLPPQFGEAQTLALFDAVQSTCEAYKCPLIGGDIALHARRGDSLVCAVTVLAVANNGRPITRGGAKPGDVVGVTGPLGGSLEADGGGRHLTFEPRIELARELARRYDHRLHAMIDISDGLGRDAAHVARMSSVQIVLDADRIPCNPGCDWRKALSDGEDYELLFAVEPPFVSHLGTSGLFRIGEVRACAEEASPRVVIKVGSEYFAAEEFGWQHSS
jgi:thiamine-monophosphate kinase